MKEEMGREQADSRESRPEELSSRETGHPTGSERLTLRDRAAAARARAAIAAADYRRLLADLDRQIAIAKETRAASEAVRETFRREVCAYVLVLKQLDHSPERTLRLVKETVTEGTPRPESDGLMADVVRWCIEAYYGTSAA